MNLLTSGFICPVHTPDGAPCGLLNHLTYHCIIPCELPNTKTLIKALFDLGMTSVESEPWVQYHQSLEVVLDGNLMGYIKKKEAFHFAQQLRAFKIEQKVCQFFFLFLDMNGIKRFASTDNYFFLEPLRS